MNGHEWKGCEELHWWLTEDSYLQVLGWDEHNTEKSHQEFQPTEPEGFPLP